MDLRATQLSGTYEGTESMSVNLSFLLLKYESVIAVIIIYFGASMIWNSVKLMTLALNSYRYFYKSGGFNMTYGKISTKQREILEYIKQEILNKGYPPAVREICEAVNLKSTSSVHAHLETLEKNGYIRRDPTKPRAIEIIDNNFNLTRREVIHVPLIGRVAAGQPLLAVENIESYFPIPAEFMPNAATFMLQVKGESMVNAGIFDGDQILVQQQSDAENGDMVVALVDDSATVKTFFKENDHIRLQPENDTMDPIIVDECTILGKVFGVFRLFS